MHHAEGDRIDMIKWLILDSFPCGRGPPLSGIIDALGPLWMIGVLIGVKGCGPTVVGGSVPVSCSAWMDLVEDEGVLHGGVGGW